MEQIDERDLSCLIDAYARRCEETLPQERYKWEAVQCFQQNWDENAPDFTDMLDRAFSKAGNLLTGYQYLPLGMLREFASLDESTTREALRALFDESVDLKARMAAFDKTTKNLLSRLNEKRRAADDHEASNSYQDPRAMNVYLTLCHPERHFLYKSSIFDRFLSLFGLSSSTGKFDRVIDYEEVCKQLLDYLTAHRADVIECYHSVLPKELTDCDPENHLLVQDILYSLEAYIHFTWMPSYHAIVEALPSYRHDRSELTSVVKDEIGSELDDMDPFTFFSLFNGKIQKDGRRRKTVEHILERLGISASLPLDFRGLPLSSALRWMFWGSDGAIENNWNMFDAARAYVSTRDEQTRSKFASCFDVMHAEKNVGQASLTMGLFWMWPNSYLPLDSRTTGYLRDKFSLEVPFPIDGGQYLDLLGTVREKAPDLSFAEISSKAFNASVGPRYWVYAPGENAREWDTCRSLAIMSVGWNEIGDLSDYKTKSAVAARLQEVNGADTSKKNDSNTLWSFQREMRPGDIVFVKRGRRTVLGRGVVSSEPRYEAKLEPYVHVRDVEWTTSGEWSLPEDAPSLPMKTLTRLDDDGLVEQIEQLMEQQIPDIPSGDDDKTKGSRKFWWLVASPRIWSFSDIELGETQSYTLRNESGNPRRVQGNFFAAEPGDTVVGYEASPVKKVVAICEIAQEHDDQRMYFRKVRDLVSPIPYEEIAADPLLSGMEFLRNPNGSLFALSDTEGQHLMELAGDTPQDNSLETFSSTYDDADFLSEVYVDERDLKCMKALLRRKRNLILQGAPGTGKTYCARRLAWNVMGRKDNTRIEMVQFHQSSTYDDLVYGFRPDDSGGFVRTPGTFVSFCQKAAARPDEPFFFIIDEINRANVSKVFGELLMLIEADHRGDSIMLPVSGERFSVPKNVYIIGMMNTADRSLALIDYALRRRFAFFEMIPALDNPHFLERCSRMGEQMVSLVKAVKALNQRIESDSSLGRGFRIGHSYFCTPDEEVENATDSELIGSIIDFELAPLLDEYWFDEPEVASSEIEKLRGAVK